MGAVSYEMIDLEAARRAAAPPSGYLFDPEDRRMPRDKPRIHVPPEKAAIEGERQQDPHLPGVDPDIEELPLDEIYRRAAEVRDWALAAMANDLRGGVLTTLQALAELRELEAARDAADPLGDGLGCLEGLTDREASDRLRAAWRASGWAGR